LSVHVTSWVLEHSEARLGDRLVLLVLADHAHEDGTGAWASQQTIAREARMSERAVRYSLKRLERAGAIVRDGFTRHGTVIYSIPLAGTADIAGPGNSRQGGRQNPPRQVSDFADEPSFEPSGEPSPLSSNVVELRGRGSGELDDQHPGGGGRMNHLTVIPGGKAIPNPVVAAFEDNDHEIIRELGWWDCWEAAHTWWAPRQRCTARDFVPYAKVLHEQDPAAVLEAFRDLAGPWRPSPSAVLARLRNGNGSTESSPVDVGRGQHRSDTPDAIRAVAAALRSGEHECGCGVPTARKWRVAPNGIRRCSDCSGVAVEQAYAAEDAGLLEEAA
jgi:hypothetical protein